MPLADAQGSRDVAIGTDATGRVREAGLVIEVSRNLNKDFRLRVGLCSKCAPLTKSISREACVGQCLADLGRGDRAEIAIFDQPFNTPGGKSIVRANPLYRQGSWRRKRCCNTRAELLRRLRGALLDLLGVDKNSLDPLRV